MGYQLKEYNYETIDGEVYDPECSELHPIEFNINRAHNYLNEAYKLLRDYNKNGDSNFTVDDVVFRTIYDINELADRLDHHIQYVNKRNKKNK